MNTIKKLEIMGFKSFYNRKEISFPTGMNVIIGPNGSGKSNILEAICFVLGKTSRKELRAERLGDLVYNGGKKLPPAQFAKVTIEIDNKNRVMPIDDDLVKISRKVDKDGHSVFRVNGKREIMDYVRNLLSHANFDPDGFNIVLQGEIEKFVDLSPDERRKLIEDVCGVSQYEEKKHKCMLELDKVEQKMKDARIILNEKMRQMENLKKEKEQAEEYAEIQHNLRIKKASKILKEKEGIEKEYDKVKKDFDSKEKEVFSEIEKRNKVSSEIINQNSKLEELNNQISEKGEKEQIELNKKVETLKIRSSELKISIKTTEDGLKKAEERKTRILNEIESGKKSVIELENSIVGISKGAEDHNKKIRADEERLDKLKNLDRERLTLLGKIAGVENELMAKTHELLEFEEQIAEQKEIINREKELKRLQKELGEKLDNDSELAVSSGELKEKQTELAKKMHQLEGKREVMLNLLKRGVRAIIAAKSQGKIKGIHGLVSSLGKADEKYTLPLKVAAGNKVNSFVVDDENVAKDCIEFLKSGKYGIATFLPLTRLKPKNVEKDKSLEKVDGVIGYAIDLIKFNKKYEEVFKYVLANTLVVDTIETAKKVGINRIRMVTLEGDLIEKSGAMIGGYHKKEISGFKETEIEDEIGKLGNQVLSTGKEFSAIDSERSVLSEDIMHLRTKVYDLESKVKKVEINMTMYASLKKEAEEKNNQKNAMKEELDALPKKIEEGTLNKLSEEIRNQHDTINNSFAELRGKELQIKITNSDINDLQNVLKSLEKERTLFSKSLEEDKKEITSVEKNLELTYGEEKKFHEKLRELFDTRHKLGESIKNDEIKKVKIEDVISRLKEQSQELGLKIAELNAKIESRVSALDEYKDLEIKEVRESVERIEQQIFELQTKLVNFGAVNMRALDVYKEVEKEHNSLKERIDKLDQEKNGVLGAITEVETKKKESFMEAFENIARYFSDCFANLSPNGEGKLLLENQENPFEGGIEVIANPGGKKMVSLRAMSGGERTLTTLAFIFAIHSYQPSPFYIMDEVEAALDKENSEKFGRLLAVQAKQSQFIVISHNDNVIAESDNVYGVHMNELGESQVVSLKLPEKQEEK